MTLASLTMRFSRRPSTPFAALPLVVFLTACQTMVAPLPQDLTPHRSSPEIETYAGLRRESLLFRANVEASSSSARAVLSKELFDLTRRRRSEYLSLREGLFPIALLNASAIVEQPGARDSHTLLLVTSLSLMAANDLVKNFHGIAAWLNHDRLLRTVWNEPEAARGIQEGSWDTSVEAYRNARYHDLFKDALEKLKKHRRDLVNLIGGGDESFRVLYPQGIDPAFKELEGSYALLKANFAEENLSGDEAELRALVERSKTLRATWAKSAPLLKEAIAKDNGLIRGNVHVRVHAAKKDYLDLREALYHLAFKHVAKLTREDIPYPREMRHRAIAISLLSAVTLYENARQVETQILTIPGVRALLNQGDPALGIPPHFWDSVEREFGRLQYRTLLEAALHAIEREKNLPGGWTENDPLLTYVSQEILASAAVAEIRGELLPSKMARVLGHYLKQVGGAGTTSVQESKVQLSKGFGNLVGVVEFRKGKLFNQPRWVEFIRQRLEPGDLLLEKTPFRLTDKFIPGHFGHVALYVGTEEQLRGLELLEHPWVSRYRDEISKGRVIVEALRDGTQINTIEHFLNIDDVAILRPKRDKIQNAEVKQAILLAFSHVGKKYDFAFDNNSWDTIVCSELAFQTYVNVRWPFAKAVGSYTIAPDDVAVLAGAGPSRPFEIVSFIHDGKVAHDRLTGVRNEGLYVQLLGKRYRETSGSTAN